ncbi:MAG: OmpA family protein [Azospirillum sp.]|nr:OmpA family protein [Azospirillum sp.]
MSAVLVSILVAACSTTPDRPPVIPGEHQVIAVPGPVSPEFNVVKAEPLGLPGSPQFAVMATVPEAEAFQMPQPLDLPEVPVSAPALRPAEIPTAPPSAPLAMPPGVTPPPPVQPVAPEESARAAITPLPQLGPPQLGPPQLAPPQASSPASPPQQLAALGPPPEVPATRPAAPVIPPEQAEAIARAAAELAGSKFRLLYGEAATALPADANEVLSRIAGLMAVSEKTRLQLQSFASGSADDPVEARRLSLERANSVRQHLVDLGIRRGRIDIRALGATAAEGPADRIDLVPIN